MKKFRTSIFSVFIVLLFSSCKDKNPIIEPIPEATNGQMQLTMKTTWYDEQYESGMIKIDDYGNRVRVDYFSSYVSSIALKRTDGSLLILKDYSLLNFGQDNVLNFTVPKGDYIAVGFLLGVPPDVNTNTDPAQYPNSHPLSVAGSQGMFWNWNTGYIFTKLEGKADISGTEGEPLLHSFSYHTGGDFYTHYVELDNDLTIVAGQTKSIQVVLHIEKIFSPDTDPGINLADEPAFHSPGPLALKFVKNFSNAFTIE